MKDVNLLINNGVNLKESLEIFGDMEAYNETLEDFLSTVDEKLNNIKTYKELSNMNNYAILVHSLKSDAKYLGFVKLAELAYKHELESKAFNINFVYENYEELVAETNRIIAVVKQYLNKETVTVVQIQPTVSLDKKLLVVDDSNIIRNIVQKIFNNEFEVLTASDGKEAINIVANDPTNSIVGLLLDLNMPNVDGFEVLEYFKQNNLFARVPVSIITGDDSKETTNRAFNYSITEVLNKPFNERDVKRVVTAMIEFK